MLCLTYCFNTIPLIVLGNVFSIIDSWKNLFHLNALHRLNGHINFSPPATDWNLSCMPETTFHASSCTHYHCPYRQTTHGPCRCYWSCRWSSSAHHCFWMASGWRTYRTEWRLSPWSQTGWCPLYNTGTVTPDTIQRSHSDIDDVPRVAAGILEWNVCTVRIVRPVGMSAGLHKQADHPAVRYERTAEINISVEVTKFSYLL